MQTSEREPQPSERCPYCGCTGHDRLTAANSRLEAELAASKAEVERLREALIKSYKAATEFGITPQMSIFSLAEVEGIINAALNPPAQQTSLASHGRTKHD